MTLRCQQHSTPACLISTVIHAANGMYVYVSVLPMRGLLAHWQLCLQAGCMLQAMLGWFNQS